MTNKSDAKKYANENTIHTVKVIESLEGLNFEPVPIKQIIDRTGIPYDKCRRVLLTLELLGWAEQTEKKDWTLGAKILRLSNRYAELIASAMNKN